MNALRFSSRHAAAFLAVSIGATFFLACSKETSPTGEVGSPIPSASPAGEAFEDAPLATPMLATPAAPTPTLEVATPVATPMPSPPAPPGAIVQPPAAVATDSPTTPAMTSTPAPSATPPLGGATGSSTQATSTTEELRPPGWSPPQPVTLRRPPRLYPPVEPTPSPTPAPTPTATPPANEREPTPARPFDPSDDA